MADYLRNFLLCRDAIVWRRAWRIFGLRGLLHVRYLGRYQKTVAPQEFVLDTKIAHVSRKLQFILSKMSTGIIPCAFSLAHCTQISSKTVH